MKRSQIKWVACIAAILMLTAVGCQKTPAGPSGEGSSTVASQPGEENAPSSVEPSETVMSQEGNSSDNQESSAPVNSAISSSSTAPASSQINASSEATSSYTFSAGLQEQLEGITEDNIPENVYVVIDRASYDKNKQYDETFFDGCDVTIVKEGSYGTDIYDINGNIVTPATRYFVLKVNQPGLKALYDVLEKLDQRDDLSIVSIEPIMILA